MLLWLVSRPLERFTALVSCDDFCNMFVLRDEVANLIPNPQYGGLGIVLSLTPALWVTKLLHRDKVTIHGRSPI